MRIKVNVTAEDIHLGRRNNCNSCPVARASKRALTAASGLATIRVAAAFSSLDLYTPPMHTDGYSWHPVLWMDWIKLPKSASQFIRRFDGKQSVKPFAFWLEV